MLKIRVIPCLDVKDGRVVKGINFKDLIDAGDPVEQARIYNQESADELCFLDISASQENRGTLLEMVEKVASKCFIPLTIGGGVRSVSDIRDLLLAGADKISINSAAVKNPQLVAEAAVKFGSQCVTVAIDAKITANGYRIFTHGGTRETELDAVEWACKMASLGAGELLVTSMDRDGSKSGFDNRLNKLITSAVKIPVIASGGAGELQDFVDGVKEGGVGAVLAASIFHFGKYKIHEVKEYMQNHDVAVRVS